jgi:hypothetical protein
MGNCNSSSPQDQRCTACGYKKCDCTAGLDSQCRTCDPSYKYNIPGTYDAQYDAWLAANPRPVKPVFDPQPDVTAGDFICTQCTQCQEFSNISAGKSLSINDAQQAMSCIGKIEAAVNSAQSSAAAQLAAENAAAQFAAQQAAANGMIAVTHSTGSGINWMLILLFILIIVLASGVGLFLVLSEEDKVVTKGHTLSVPI